MTNPRRLPGDCTGYWPRSVFCARDGTLFPVDRLNHRYHLQPHARGRSSSLSIKIHPNRIRCVWTIAKWSNRPPSQSSCKLSGLHSERSACPGMNSGPEQLGHMSNIVASTHYSGFTMGFWRATRLARQTTFRQCRGIRRVVRPLDRSMRIGDQGQCPQRPANRGWLRDSRNHRRRLAASRRYRPIHLVRRLCETLSSSYRHRLQVISHSSAPRIGIFAFQHDHRPHVICQRKLHRNHHSTPMHAEASSRRISW